MNDKEAVEYLEKCLNKNTIEYKYIMLGNPKLEKSIRELLKKIKECKK